MLSWKRGQKLEKLPVVKSWLFWTSRYRGCSLAAWIVTRDSNLTSCRSDVQQVGSLGCLLQTRVWVPGQVRQVVGQSSTFLHALGAAHWHSQSLGCTREKHRHGALMQHTLSKQKFSLHRCLKPLLSSAFFMMSVLEFGSELGGPGGSQLVPV